MPLVTVFSSNVFVRQLAEALKYAYGRRIIHRALTPRSVLVISAATGKPQLKIFNWQLGRPLGTVQLTPASKSLTLYPSQLTEGSDLVYTAPEALQNRAFAAAAAVARTRLMMPWCLSSGFSNAS